MMKIIVVWCLLLFHLGVIQLRSQGQESCLAPTPPMGWNSFDSYGVYLHEKAAYDNLEKLAEYKKYGYEFFVIDNGWFGEYNLRSGTSYSLERHASDVHINAYGLYQPSQCYFPNGLQGIIDRCHESGLKFGIHLMRGIPRKAVELNLPIKDTPYRAADIADKLNSCEWCHYNYGVDMSKPGAQAFYNSLINQLAAWGVDFIKVDDIVPYPEEVKALVKAVEQCGRDMVISLSPGDKVPVGNIEAYRQTNMLRVTGDVWDTQNDIDKCFTAWKKWSGYEQPGFWIDMDMIPFGRLQLMSPKLWDEQNISQSALYAGKGYSRQSELNKDQMQTFITLRAMAASPLFIGGDLSSMDKYAVQLLTTPEMIACNQHGSMGKTVYEQDGIEVWRVKEKNKDGGWIGVFNRTNNFCQWDFILKEFSIDPKTKIKDIWMNKQIPTKKGVVPLQINPHGVVFIRF